MKAKNEHLIAGAEGSQNKGPERKAAVPDPEQVGRQREMITICKPAPEVRNTRSVKTDIQ